MQAAEYAKSDVNIGYIAFLGSPATDVQYVLWRAVASLAQ